MTKIIDEGSEEDRKYIINLKQIAKHDNFDGHHADTILEIIRSFLDTWTGKCS